VTHFQTKEKCIENQIITSHLAKYTGKEDSVMVKYGQTTLRNIILRQNTNLSINLKEELLLWITKLNVHGGILNV